MKILSGKHSRRNINVVGRTRPPLLRMRQSIFDILEVEGKSMLDLCAGSGSFGLEALSRGAKFVYFVEENIATGQNLMHTLETWDEQNAKVIIKNVKYLPRSTVQVDLIFFDPPFGHNYITSIQDRVFEKAWCHDQTKMMVRYNEELPDANKYWKLIRMKQIGKSFIHFYELR